MNCSQCGNALAANAKFCNRCGARQTPSTTISDPSAATAPVTAPAEKICPVCQAVCKPLARFCPKCGNSFPADTGTPSIVPVEVPALDMPPGTPAALSESTQADSALAAGGLGTATSRPKSEAPTSLASTSSAEPPRIEPMTTESLRPTPAWPTDHASYPPPPPPFLSDLRATSHNAPAMPQEPSRHNQSWIKWLVLVLVLIAIGAGVLLARNMGAFPGMGGSTSQTPSSAATPADRNAISAEDKAKADALVGPQGAGNAPAPANDPSVVTINPPADNVDVAAPPATQATISSPTPTPAIPEVTVSPASPAPDTAVAPPPAPARPAKPQSRPAVRNGSPTLDDLLD